MKQNISFSALFQPFLSLFKEKKTGNIKNFHVFNVYMLVC